MDVVEEGEHVVAEERWGEKEEVVVDWDGVVVVEGQKGS